MADPASALPPEVIGGFLDLLTALAEQAPRTNAAIEYQVKPFVIKKVVGVAPEAALEALFSLARGIKKSPAFFIGEQIFVDQAGHGEEAALRARYEQQFQDGVAAVAAAVRWQFLIRQQAAAAAETVATVAVRRDP